MGSGAFLLRGLRSVLHRICSEGPRRTCVWLYGQGLPLVTGIPHLRFSRITSALHVGPQHGHAGKRFLTRQGFTHSVSLRAEFDDVASGLALAHHCHLPTIDGEAPSLEHLDQGTAFLRAAVTEGAKVYIHCQSGIGRAPTLTAAFLRSQGVNLPAALEAIRRVRPFVALTPVQLDRLAEFELTLVKRS
jgi:predicted protein tyrosine phosphatase